MGGNLFTEKGRTRFRNFALKLRSYFLLSLGAGAIAGGFVIKSNYESLSSLEKVYLRQYVTAHIKTRLIKWGQSRYVLLIAAQNGILNGVTDDQVFAVRDEQGRPIKNQYGWIFEPYERDKIERLCWRPLYLHDRAVATWLKENVYHGRGPLDFLRPGLVICSAVSIFSTLAALAIDYGFNRKYERGQQIRGDNRREWTSNLNSGSR